MVNACQLALVSRSELVPRTDSGRVSEAVKSPRPPTPTSLAHKPSKTRQNLGVKGVNWPEFGGSGAGTPPELWSICAAYPFCMRENPPDPTRFRLENHSKRV